MKKLLKLLMITTLFSTIVSCADTGEKLAENNLFKAAYVKPRIMEDESLLEKPLLEWNNNNLKTIFTNVHPTRFVASGADENYHNWTFDDFTTDKESDYDFEYENKIGSKSFNELDFYLYNNYKIFNDIIFPRPMSNPSFVVKWAIVNGKVYSTLALTIYTGADGNRNNYNLSSLYITDDVVIEDDIITVTYKNEHKTITHMTKIIDLQKNKEKFQIEKMPEIKLVIDTSDESNFSTTISIDDKFSNKGTVIAKDWVNRYITTLNYEPKRVDGRIYISYADRLFYSSMEYLNK